MASNLHIGEKIREKIKERGCSISWFARQLNCDRSNVYDIFGRANMDTKLLFEVCEVLEWDCFAELSMELRKGKGVEKDSR